MGQSAGGRYSGHVATGRQYHWELIFRVFPNYGLPEDTFRYLKREYAKGEAYGFREGGSIRIWAKLDYNEKIRLTACFCAKPGADRRTVVVVSLYPQMSWW